MSSPPESSRASGGTSRLNNMRFMLRAREQTAAITTASSSSWSAAPPARVALPPGASARLRAVIDDETTAARSLGTTVTDDGAIVGGRRSFRGANAVVESWAKSVYAGVKALPDVDEMEMAAALAPHAAQRKRARAVDAARADGAAGASDNEDAGGGAAGEISAPAEFVDLPFVKPQQQASRQKRNRG